MAGSNGKHIAQGGDPERYYSIAIKLLAVMALAGLMMGGCAPREDVSQKESSYTIGVVTKSSDSEYWMSVCSGMTAAAQRYGVSVLILSPNSETEEKIQKKMINDLIEKGVDALAISPIQSFSAEYLKKARERGICVVAYDTKIMEEGVPYIGIDNEKAGRELAGAMAELLGNTGKVGIVTGNLDQTAHSERLAGIQSYIEGHTDMEVAFVESGYSNLRMSDIEISRLLTQYPDIRGIFATSAVTALGIMEYLGDTQIQIMTVDVQQDAIEAVRSGKIAALVAQSGYDIGYETVKSIVGHRGMDGVLEDKILGAEILTRENIEGWKE